MRIVLDTSIFIARESRRPLGDLPPGAHLGISVVTLAELRTGVLTAREDSRAARLATYDAAANFEVIPVDRSIADLYASLAAHAVAHGRKPRVQDLWIAATALARDAAVATQDSDFDLLPGVEVVKL